MAEFIEGHQMPLSVCAAMLADFDLYRLHLIRKVFHPQSHNNINFLAPDEQTEKYHFFLKFLYETYIMVTH